MTASPWSNPPSDFIAGRFIPIPGERVQSRDPSAPSRIVWSGSPRVEHVDLAVTAARTALPAWAEATINDRIAALRRWQAVAQKHVERIAAVITDEMGKTLAESRLEAKLLADKVEITLGEHSMNRVREYEVAASPTRAGLCRYKPHGVMAVIGPFNFPAHLPNGHFVPALLMGNTIVFKPSDKTPGVGQLLAELMHEAAIPPGVFNLVQGAADIASALVSHADIDGILFTGSWPVGRRILEANLDRPGRIIALEMGGNNAAIVMPTANLRQAVLECIRAGFATTGQRCTCTRRIILHRDVADRFIAAFCKAASTILIGPGRATEPVFMGPVVSQQAADAVIEFQRDLARTSRSGARILVESTRLDRPGWFITPGVARVDSFSLDRDVEVFGPLVQIAVVDHLDSAIEQANRTRYGLAASIFTNDDAEYERFFREVRAGCINRNTGTAGASGKLPFGGLGHSGNHRPAGAFSVDYCAYPIANMVEQGNAAAVPEGVMWNDAWV
jgi:succinylglutamic semialdehyde dehydrogenase